MSQQPQQICDNCQKSFPQSKSATHFGYCRRNIKKCQTCGQMYDINFTEEHEEQFHKMSACKYCSKSFKPHEVAKHEGKCEARTQYCEYCDLDVPARDYPAHLRQCESRTKQCEKCRRPIANKDHLIHTISCAGMIEEPKPSISTSQNNKHGNYEQFIRQAQKRQDVKKYQYKPSYQQPKRQSSKGGVQRLGERQRERKPQPYSQNVYGNNIVRPVEMKKDLPQSNKPTYTSQNKPTINYTDINMNKNLPQYGEKRVPNIGQKDKYARMQPSKNVDSGKNLGSGKVIENKHVTYSRTNANEPITTTTYGIRKSTQEVSSKVNPSTNINVRGYQPLTNQTNTRTVQPSSSYSKVQQPYKRQIPSSKEVYVRRQVEKPKQVQPKKQINYGQYANDYKPDNQTYDFRKQQTRKYQQPARTNPKPQIYVPPTQQYRPAQQPRSYQSPPQNTFTGNTTGEHDEDEQLQKAIMASLGNMNVSKSPQHSQPQQKQKHQYKIDDIPPEFLQNDMMNESFYGKQIALMEQIEKNKKKR